MSKKVITDLQQLDQEGGPRVFELRGHFAGAGFSLKAELPVDEKMPDLQGLTEVLAFAAGVSTKQSGPVVALE